jgi:hypothetical protein
LPICQSRQRINYKATSCIWSPIVLINSDMIDIILQLPSRQNTNNNIIMIINGLSKLFHSFEISELIFMRESSISLFIRHNIPNYGVSIAILSNSKVHYQWLFWAMFIAKVWTKLWFLVVFYPQIRKSCRTTKQDSADNSIYL